MLNITLDLDTGLAKLAAATTIKAGAQVPVTISTFRGATPTSPGASPAFELGLGTDATPPALKAYLATFSAENAHTFTGVLDANDTRLVTFMAGKGSTSFGCEVAWTVAGELEVAPSFIVPVQARIIPSDPTSEGGPDFYTETEVDALLAAKLDTGAQAADVNPAGTAIAAALANLPPPASFPVADLTGTGTGVAQALQANTNAPYGTVALDAYARLPGLDGSQLTNLSVPVANLTGVGAGVLDALQQAVNSDDGVVAKAGGEVNLVGNFATSGGSSALSGRHVGDGSSLTGVPAAVADVTGLGLHVLAALQQDTNLPGGMLQIDSAGLLPPLDGSYLTNLGIVASGSPISYSGDIAPGAFVEGDLIVTGALADATQAIALDHSGLDDGLGIIARLSATDTVTVRIYNYTAATITYAEALVVVVRVIK